MRTATGFARRSCRATRGEGGQNEIGPELFEALAVLRTEELLAAHRFDGAEQYFTRAVDFGYSFSIDETLEKWGKQEILGDYVRMIRTIRPDVIVGFVFDGAGGGQHHQASSRLTAEAFRAAADPKAFPEQIQKEGCGPGRRRSSITPPALAARRQRSRASGASKVLRVHRRRGVRPGARPHVRRDRRAKGAACTSARACRSCCRCLPARATEALAARAATGCTTRCCTGGVNREESRSVRRHRHQLKSLAAFAGATPPAALTETLERIRAAVGDARKAFDAGGSGAAVPALVRGLSAVRELRAQRWRRWRSSRRRATRSIIG